MPLVSHTIVGRGSELGALLAAADQARTATSTVAVVGGEAGVGKSRLVHELASRLTADGFLVLHGQCVALGAEGLPFAPLVDALRALRRAGDPGELADWLGASRPQLARLLPDLAVTADEIPTEPLALAQLLELVLGVLERVSASRPLLLVVEDLQWADRSSLDLVAFLVRALRGSPVLMVLTYRSDELHRQHPVRPVLSQWDQARQVVRVDLERLGREQVREQLTAILGASPRPAVLDLVLERTDGNPFLVEEVASSITRGTLDAVPSSVRDVLLARVDALGEPARAVVRTASVAGRAVADRLLAAVAGLPVGAMAVALREALEQQVLTIDEHAQGYRFRHSLMREAVYADLLPGERASLHAAYAAVLDGQPALAGTRAERSAALAAHWFAAGDLPRALEASLDAASDATAANAPSEAQRHLERALVLWPRVHDPGSTHGVDEVGLLAAAAEAAFDAGALERSLELVDAALSEAGSASGTRAMLLERRTRAMRGLGDDSNGVLLLREALALLGDGDHGQLRASILASLANSVFRLGEMAEAARTARLAVAESARTGGGRLEADAFITLGTALCYLDQPDDGLAAIHAGIDRAHRLGDARTLVRGHVNLSDALELQGRHEEAATAARSGLVMARESGLSRSLGAYLLGNLVEPLVRLGRLDEADALAAAELDRELEGVFAASLLELRGQIALMQGRSSDVKELVAEARRQVGQVNDLQFAQPLAYLEASLAYDADDLPAVHRIIDAALTGDPAGWSARYSWPVLWIAARVGSTRREVAKTMSTGTPAARAHQRLVAAEGADSPAAWEECVAAWRDTGEPYLLAYSLLRSAGAAAGCGRREAAQRQLRECAQVAERLGAQPLLDDARALARRARLDLGHSHETPQADRLSAYGLTARELEVLRLVAEGRSNRQVATALFISPKTVSVHMSNLMAKLGVAGRGEAAALAHRLGVPPT